MRLEFDNPVVRRELYIHVTCAVFFTELKIKFAGDKSYPESVKGANLLM